MSLILAVDDEKSVLDLLEKVLKREGFEFESAKDGKEALKLAKSKRPDLILLDIQMDGMDGQETLKKLKEDEKTRDIPIIMLTAKYGGEDVEEAIRNYADKYVTKPFGTLELVSQIRKTLTATGRLEAKKKR